MIIYCEKHEQRDGDVQVDCPKCEQEKADAEYDREYKRQRREARNDSGV